MDAELKWQTEIDFFNLKLKIYMYKLDRNSHGIISREWADKQWRKKKKNQCVELLGFCYSQTFFFFVFIYKKYKMTESKSILTTDYAIDF